MRLYENAFPTTYEEIKTWYPVWYREVLEMDALWRAWGKHLDEIQAGIIQAVDNNFIELADAQAISRLETFLLIEYDGPRTLAERKDVIRALIIGQGRIGQRQIKELISVFTDGEITVSLIGGTIRISVKRDFGERFNLFDCKMILERRIPAHLGLSFDDDLQPVSAFNRNVFIFRDLNMLIRIKNRTVTANGPMLNGERLLDGTWLLNSALPGLPFIDFGVKVNTLYQTAISKQRFDIAGIMATNKNVFTPGDLKMPFTIKNRTACASGPLLNGEMRLDGSWLLNSAYPGLPFIDFGVTVKSRHGIDVSARRLDVAGIVFKNQFGVSAVQQFILSVVNPQNLEHIDTGIGVTFRNHGMQMLGAALNGTLTLDGTWPLYGEYRKIFSGIAARNLNMGAFPVKNESHITAQAGFSLAAKNQGSVRQANVHISVSARQSYNLAGRIAMDSRWKLDGTAKLDGSRKLNQIYIEEDL